MMLLTLPVCLNEVWRTWIVDVAWVLRVHTKGVSETWRPSFCFVWHTLTWTKDTEVDPTMCGTATVTSVDSDRQQWLTWPTGCFYQSQPAVMTSKKSEVMKSQCQNVHITKFCGPQWGLFNSKHMPPHFKESKSTPIEREAEAEDFYHTLPEQTTDANSRHPSRNFFSREQPQCRLRNSWAKPFGAAELLRGFWSTTHAILSI